MTACEADRTPPARWYLDPAVLRRETDAVFGRAWLWAGRADAVASPGAFVASRHHRRQHVVVRGEDGELRAFHNVCRHHAARLVDGEGSCSRLVCPYHGWEYGHDGRLLRAPGAGAAARQPEHLALVPLAVDVLGPLLLVHRDRGAPPLSQELAALLPDLRLAGLRHVQHRTYHLRCNWKVFVDNYLDGGYHVAVAHRALGEQLALQGYRTDLLPRGAVQRCRGAGGEASGEHGDFAARIGDEAVYLWLYPGLMLNRYGPVLDVNVVVPEGPEATTVEFDWWLEEEAAADPSFVARCIAQSDRVQQEDAELCARVQDGLASGAFDRGPYAGPEAAMKHFHHLLAADLG